MRIAISGTHCCGKSTLIESFLNVHPDYEHVEEAYKLLQGHGESFGAEPSGEDYFRQLEYHLKTLKQYKPGDRVIFERSPVDYVAYLQSLVELARDNRDVSLTQRAVAASREAIQLLDVIAFLPLAGNRG